MKKFKDVKVEFPKGYFEKIKKEKRPLIYDCFTFFNELDLLEVRLEELEKVVDFFVIAEATATFSGKEKPLYFEKNKKRFSRWKNKIIYVQVKKMPSINLLDKFFINLEKILPRKPQLILRKILARVIGGVARYKMIEYQRRVLITGLKYAKEEDILLGIDVDEIPNPSKFEEMKKVLERYKFVEFEQENFRYFFNGVLTGEERYSPGTRSCLFKTLLKDLRGNIDFLRTTPFFWRKLKPKKYGPQNYYLLKKAGWHFSYLGGIEKVIEKFQNVSHPELDKKQLKDPNVIRKMIEEGKTAENKKIKYIKIDSSFPKSLRKRLKDYKLFIRDTNDKEK